ncbi:S-adenosylmethionine--tRNA ribosyltransferase-isomerase [Granulicella pectinivorans]|uniref:S-adenosylmethionine:tRNA ribosyltransferase-isomerase n=1 Tax=Granulicella pectinivorans TaxID=474950 RepID=A0A1I6N1E4_9BACT|nr:tRNA preQ1(34) S-adenosylmethionine ribosyltransferase-isomerase QueA [Granulicella pectinivorans]SFS21750.1 S-adenosylmethionine--tRNA ribosyltransferase-isomerase [Granulicella pectinivorans]
MLTADFDFHLPESLIAQTPPPVRGSSRMLVVDRATGAYTDGRFTDLPEHLGEGDLLILNDSRVLPARLFGTRARSTTTQASSPDPSGRVEVLLTQQVAPGTWTTLVRPAKKVQVGEKLLFHEGAAVVLEAVVLGAGEYGERTLRFSATDEFEAILQRIGHMPLPPYIHRDKGTPDSEEDRARYQTVYANQTGSAAAPTAGLHFTPEVLEALTRKGVQIERVTLHVGLGTFQPVRAERVVDIRLHAERYTLPAATAEAINVARREGRRIIAAGTTTTRTLEHCATLGAELYPHSGETSIFLSPGHRFQVVSGLLTNFHLPQSTLLMLVCAFAGTEHVLAAYAHAVEAKYRFFSYGDCMLLL